jgi:hypothetical protein
MNSIDRDGVTITDHSSEKSALQHVPSKPDVLGCRESPGKAVLCRSGCFQCS